MAEFALFAPRLLKWERGFSFDAADSGGATKDGVTLRTFAAYCRKKHWPEPGIDQLLALTALQWTEIMRDYWDRCRADQWRDQCLADFVVDWYVNAGDRQFAHCNGRRTFRRTASWGARRCAQ